MAIQVAIQDLDSWLQAQPENTADTPYEIEITGLTTNELGTFSTVISQNNTKYLDLTETQMPSGTMSWYTSQLTTMVEPPKLPSDLRSAERLFYGCTALKHGAVIPQGVTNMEQTYTDCTSLISATIPQGVTTIKRAFSLCSSLTQAPIIPNSVVNMESAFSGSSITQMPEIPNSVTDLIYTFSGCDSLVDITQIPSSVTTLSGTFVRCTSLVSAPVIPDWVTNMAGTFFGCTSLSYKPIIPSTVTTSTNCYNGVTTPNWKGTESQAESFLSTFFAQTTDSELRVYQDDRETYEYSYINVDISTLSTYLAGLDPNTVSTAYKIYIRGLSSSDYNDIKTALIANSSKYVDLNYTVLPNGITSLEETFENCLSLVVSPAIPSGVTDLTSTFKNCSSLTDAPSIPSAVTDISNAFEGCSNITEIAIISSSVTSAIEAFKNCTSLLKIDEFHIPLNTLKNNPDFQDMFAGCTSLTQVGYKIDTDTWHAYRLKFDANSVEGKIFGFNNGQFTSTAVQNTQISKNGIRLPVLTDELWFPPANMSDSDVEDVIRSVLNNRYTYWNKAVIDPSSKSLVMMASDPNNVVSNFLNGGGGGGVEKLVISTTRSVNVTKDTRIFADGSAITITLNYGSSAEGYVAEVYAIQACTITYYTAQGTTTSLAMEAGGKAIFVYFSGWKLHSNYGTTNSVSVDNMQSVSSNAVAQQLQLGGFIKYYDVDYGNLTVSANNYIALSEILPNKTIIGFNLKYWSQNSGCFSLQIYRRSDGINVPYLIANNGFSVLSFRVTYFYID